MAIERYQTRGASSHPSHIRRRSSILLRRLALWCPLFAVILATGLLALFDASLHHAFFGALVLVWFGLILFGALVGRRPR